MVLFVRVLMFRCPRTHPQPGLRSHLANHPNTYAIVTISFTANQCVACVENVAECKAGYLASSSQPADFIVLEPKHNNASLSNEFRPDSNDPLDEAACVLEERPLRVSSMSIPVVMWASPSGLTALYSSGNGCTGTTFVCWCEDGCVLAWACAVAALTVSAAPTPDLNATREYAVPAHARRRTGIERVQNEIAKVRYISFSLAL